MRLAEGHAGRGTRRTIPDLPQEKRTEPTCAERASAPFLHGLSGYSPIRVAVRKKWALPGEYAWA